MRLIPLSPARTGGGARVARGEGSAPGTRGSPEGGLREARRHRGRSRDGGRRGRQVGRRRSVLAGTGQRDGASPTVATGVGGAARHRDADRRGEREGWRPPSPDAGGVEASEIKSSPKGPRRVHGPACQQQTCASAGTLVTRPVGRLPPTWEWTAAPQLPGAQLRTRPRSSRTWTCSRLLGAQLKSPPCVAMCPTSNCFQPFSYFFLCLPPFFPNTMFLPPSLDFLPSEVPCTCFCSGGSGFISSHPSTPRYSALKRRGASLQALQVLKG